MRYNSNLNLYISVFFLFVHPLGPNVLLYRPDTSHIRPCCGYLLSDAVSRGTIRDQWKLRVTMWQHRREVRYCVSV